MSCATSVFLGSSRGLVSRCKVYSGHIHTVEVIGSNPIAPTIFSSTCRHFRFGSGAIWGHFSNLLDDASLRSALRPGHSLNVGVHGDTDVCMAHQCLHRRHIFTVRFEQHTERVSERIPADPSRNPGSLRCRTDVIPSRSMQIDFPDTTGFVCSHTFM